MDIRDVPLHCGSCQRGWGNPHKCDAPRYCPCEQSAAHTNEEQDD